MSKYLTVEEANRLLNDAEKENPGGWADHSRYVGYAARIIAQRLDLDAEKAEAFGLVHDIGRKVGRCSLKHVYEGYKYLKDLGYDDAAKISLTHSFFENTAEGPIGEWDFDEENVRFVKEYIENVEFDMYDKIVQLADCLCLSTGITVIERRMVDVFYRYGFDDYFKNNLDARLRRLNEIEEMIGASIYSLFPEEITKNLIENKNPKIEDYEN